MNKKLYPPQLAGTLPAFYKSYNKVTGEATAATLLIPYAMNQGVSYGQINGFCLRIKNVASGTYVCPPQYSDRYDTDKDAVVFNISKEYAGIFEEGQFYKVQLAYYAVEESSTTIGGADFVVDESDPNAYKHIGYFSTVGIIKCVPFPSVTISGYSLDSTNLFTGSFLGIYDITDAIDKTESVYSYTFSIYNSANELYYTTGELIHNSSNDVEYGLSTDTLIINDFISATGDIYQIEYTVTTLNGLTISSPRYRMTSEQLLAPNKKIEVIVTPNPDEAYMEISFLGESTLNYEGNPEEDVYYGEFILARACEEDGYTEWIEMHRFRLQDERPSSISFRDFAVKQGVKYKYGVSQFNMWNIVSSRLESKEVSIDFEDMFLFDGKRQLKIRFNPKMTKFGTTVLEQKVETIGNKYPFIFRNGKVEYKEFPISGLISYQMDNARLFYKTDYDLILSRKYTETKGVENEEGIFNHFDLTEENILRERNFKLDVLDWLNNGKPKVFKSATEGNYIVRLLKVSLSPNDKLGRMLHTFSCTACEIADFTYENLYKMGFVEKSTISRFVALWKTYNFAKWGPGEDVVINFDSEVSEFLIQDLMPGTKVELYRRGIIKPLEVIIGTTGSYRYAGGQQDIYKIVIPVAEGQRISGTMECQYNGLRYSDFDSIKDIKLKTIVSQQFVGVDPALLALEHVKPDGILEDDIKSLNARILNNKYSSTVDGPSKSEQIYKALKIGYAGTLFDRFLAGDVVQLIKSDIYDFKKSKLKILNLEQAHFRVRDLIPIYKVPYEYLPTESQKYVQQHGGHTGNPQANIRNYDAYQGTLSFNAFFWSVTPFGQPYPIDEMTKIIQGDAVMNDPFCMFELFEYRDGKWEHFSNLWADATNNEHYNGGFYYDAYYGEQYEQEKKGTRSRALTKIYDPTFFIEDRMIFAPVDDTKSSDTELSLNETLNILLNKSPLYIKENDNYILFYENGTRINPELNEPEDFYYFSRIVFDQQGESIEQYTPIKKSIVETYRNNKDYYNDLLWVKDPYTGEYIKLKDYTGTFMQNTLCVAQPNEIDLRYGKELHFDNLGEINSLRIGNGVMAELTFQLQIIDYLTEEINSDVVEAKNKYLEKSKFLKSIFEDYENIAVADSEYRKYQALYRAYTKILNGSAAEDIPDLTNLEHLIILALLNIKQVPRAVVVAMRENSRKGSEIWEQLNSLLERSVPTYDFNTILDKIEPTDSVVKGIVKRYYSDNSTLSKLNLMDMTEYRDLQGVLTLEEIEGMLDKIQKVQNIADEINGQYTILLNEKKELEDKFTEEKDSLHRKIDQYNKLLRGWFMCMFLAESQAHEKPVPLPDIKSYYQKLLYNLDGEIYSENETISSGFSKAEELTARLQKRLEELQTFEKIKRDKQDDKLFDDYVTQKEYECIESVFVLLQRFYLVYTKWQAEDVDHKLHQQYLNAYDKVMAFFMEYESFNNLLSVVRGAYSSGKKECDNLLETIFSFYPSAEHQVGKIPADEIIEESKVKAKEYIFAVDDLEYTINFCINQLVTTMNKDTNLKEDMERTKPYHTNKRNAILNKFFTFSERQKIQQDRIQRDIERYEGSSSDFTNLAVDESKYFTSGIDSTGFTEDDIRWSIERRERIIVLLELIDRILNAIGSSASGEQVLQYISGSLLAGGAPEDAPNLRNVTFVGFCKDGINPSVKNFNSFIEVRRAAWESALKESKGSNSEMFYKTTLWRDELKKYLDEINNDRRLANEPVIPYPSKYIDNYAVKAKYSLLSDELYETGQPLATIRGLAENLSKIENAATLGATVNFNEIYNEDLRKVLKNIKFDEGFIGDQICTIYFNQTLRIYSINEFIPYIVGYAFDENKKSGIFHWFVRYSLTPQLNYYLQILEQASVLLADYMERKDNYAAKQRDYESKYLDAKSIYDDYAKSDAMDYYKENSTEKQRIINEATLSMETAWNEFILALDKGFTEEIERGMYV